MVLAGPNDKAASRVEMLCLVKENYCASPERVMLAPGVIKRIEAVEQQWKDVCTRRLYQYSSAETDRK